MRLISDQNYLLNRQYRDASNLQARIVLHVRFSTNKYGWMLWAFDQLHLPWQCRVLELGCGNADLWRVNMGRVPNGWDITLSDFSPGMLAEAQRNLGGHAARFRFETIDAQSIPFEGASFDAVLANHMLQHVPDRPRALREIRRVLKPSGRMYTTTVGENHICEMRELVKRFEPTAWPGRERETMGFLLENGAAQLQPYFSHIEMRRYEDALEVNEVKPLVDYVFSGLTMGLAPERRDEFTAFVERELAARGSIHITKDSGIFEAWGSATREPPTPTTPLGHAGRVG